MGTHSVVISAFPLAECNEMYEYSFIYKWVNPYDPIGKDASESL